MWSDSAPSVWQVGYLHLDMLLVSFIKDRIWIGEYFQWHCRLILLLHFGLGSLVGANLSWGLTGLQTVMASNFSCGISENSKGVYII